MKKILFAVLVGAVVTAVQADYLYWMVGDAQAATAEETSEYFAALYMGNDQVARLTGEQVVNLYEWGDAAQYTLPTTVTGTDTFYVEILSGRYVGYKNEPTAFSDLSQYIVGSGTSIPGWSGVGFGSGDTTYNVPEPTSGLLLLVGGMLLGLKRRRQV